MTAQISRERVFPVSLFSTCRPRSRTRSETGISGDLGVDIVFVQQRNLANGNQKIHEIADFLDRNLEMFRYSDGSGDSALIAVWERRWNIEDEELHYQFHIRERILVEETVNLMQDMEENNVGIKEDS